MHDFERAILMDGVVVGEEFQSGGFLIFFSNAHLPYGAIHELYPGMRFQFLRQVHGTRVIRAPSIEHDRPQGDAMWTVQRNLALAVQTADCIPLVAVDAVTGICAIAHVGWRGLLSGLVGSFVADLRRYAAAFDVFVGPHIHCSALQVATCVSDELAPVLPGLSTASTLPAYSSVELAEVTLTAFQLAGARLRSLFVHPCDTFSDELYASEQRGMEEPARQLSFVARCS